MSVLIAAVAVAAGLVGQAPPAEPPAPAFTVKPAGKPAAAGKRRVLVLDFKAQGVDENTTRTITDVVANAFAQDARLLVTSGADLRAVLDVGADKSAAGCTADNCLAEIAGALGADIIIVGSVGRLGELLIVTMSIYDAVAQASVAKTKVEDTNIASLSPKLDRAVEELLGKARTAPASSMGAAAGDAGVPVLLIAGVATAAGGAVLTGVGGLAAASFYGVLEDPQTLTAQKDSASFGYPLALTGVVVGSTAVLGGAIVTFVGINE